mmetsp:Transcript_52868/g.72421  ORF Transcript_52868/g.72421 Transcript_52868/m.72421 type:complete len:163 (-) Transcript_52868:292-780(-)
MMITFGLFTVGDLICQKHEHKFNGCSSEVVSYDYTRALRLGAVIGGTVAPLNYFYTQNITKNVAFKSMPKCVNAFFKVAAHSALLLPLQFYISLWMAGTIKNQFDHEAGYAYMNEKYTKVLTASLYYWPALLFCAYTFLPMSKVNVFLNTTSLGFAVILSYI